MPGISLITMTAGPLPATKTSFARPRNVSARRSKSSRGSARSGSWWSLGIDHAYHALGLPHDRPPRVAAPSAEVARGAAASPQPLLCDLVGYRLAGDTRVGPEYSVAKHGRGSPASMNVVSISAIACHTGIPYSDLVRMGRVE